MTVFLVGMPGSGKSSIGQRIAQALQVPFYDTDNIISSLQDMSVEDIFKTMGEDKFRQMEADLIHGWKLRDIVIATGGGLPCHNQLMERLNELGTTVWLKSSLANLHTRLLSEMDTRPLMSGKTEAELLRYLKTTSAERKQFYSQARIKIINNRPPEEVSARIVSRLYSIKR